MSTVWMRVSNDIYELPEVVAGTVQELAYLCGVKRTSIYSSICHYNKDERRQRYVKVEIEEDEDA